MTTTLPVARSDWLIFSLLNISTPIELLILFLDSDFDIRMEALAFTVLEKLSSAAYKELEIIWNFKEDMERMKNTVSMITAVLLDAEAKANNHQVSNWLEKLKDVLYDADDLLEDFSIEALRRKVMAGNNRVRRTQAFFSKSNKIACGLKLGYRMKAIQKRLDDIAKTKHDLQLNDRPMENPIAYREQRQTYSFVSKDEVIGRDEEKKCIKSYLLDDNATNNVSIIPIVGIGGLGKTALAQLVYNDNDVQGHFELKMWVHVSDEFDIKKISRDIIGDEKNGQMEQVQQQLRNKIEGKKFLLVLDDVWNEDHELWLKLKSMFMDGGKGSMIIVTTRSQTVAKITGTHPPLFLKGLDSQKSQELFSRVAFCELKEQNDLELLAIGMDIVKKCAGVPLAIRTIGSLLFARNLGRSDWLYFKDAEFSKIDQHKDKIFAILKLSYDHLPSFLKKCFAYCSLFPKGFMFEKKTLIQLWVAEGFIQQSNDIRCVEDVGHEYFMSLLSMSFFQDVSIDDCGGISTCKMHDIMHDLAQLVTGNEYVVVEGEELNIGNRTRYLSSRRGIQLSPISSSSYKLRTFHVVSPQMNASNRFLQSDVFSFSGLKFLRVLTLCGLNIEEIPNSIEEMKHLRYIDLSRNNVLKNLPPTITSLLNLQTLKLSDCSKLEILPENLNRSLRHLELNGCESLTCMPCGLGQLTDLQTLTLFVLNSGSTSVNELGELNNLRGRLELKGLNFLRNNAEKIESAKDPFEDDLSSPNKNLVEDEIIFLGLQPHHHSLRKLVIDGFCGSRLPDWMWNLSSLLTLEFHNCNSLTSLPEEMSNLVSLQKLCISNCLSLNWNKISSIREVKIIRRGTRILNTPLKFIPGRPSLLKYFT
ncbi:NBS-LRR type disease resistance protein [Medicago truncatula]|uniref:NBS-LRR type disease resistance protein n=1 Tax=Medicago truncatula TaxID=3880 RepID=G7IVX5_MEDTR|nr:NBS-LRR type disease resistance protein [Medicago truncatula]